MTPEELLEENKRLKAENDFLKKNYDDLKAAATKLATLLRLAKNRTDSKWSLFI